MNFGRRGESRTRITRRVLVGGQGWKFLSGRPWVLVGIVALAARLIPFLIAVGDVRHFLVFPDSFEYEQLAVNLLYGHGYSEAFAPPFVPDVRRTPVYPIVLAAIYLAVGHHPALAIAANAILGAVACLLTLELGRRVAGTVTGIVAGLFLATDVTSILYGLTLLTETLFTVFLVLCGIAVVESIASPTVRRYVATGALAAVLCGLAILTRPIALFLPVALGPALALVRRDFGWGVRIWLSASFILIATAFPLGWTVRNYLVAGVAQPTSVIAINAYYDRASLVVKQQQGKTGEEEETPAALPDSATSPAQVVTGSDVVSLERRAWQIISSDPLGYLELYIHGIHESLRPDRDILTLLSAQPANFRTAPARNGEVIPPTTLIRRPEPNAALLATSTLQLLVVYALAVVGAASGLYDQSLRPMTSLLLLVILYFLLVSGPEAYPRFRVPMMPFIVLVAAEGVYQLVGIASRTSKAITPTNVWIK